MYHPNHSNNALSIKQPRFIPSPIICSPSLIRQPTTFESLTSTLQSFSLPSPFRQSHNHISSSDSSFCSHQPSRTTSHLNHHVSPSSTHPLRDPSDRSIFSSWFQFNHRRHLLLIYSIGVALWDTEDLEAVTQVCWIRWDHLTPSLKTPSQIDSSDYLTAPHNQKFLHNLEPVSAAVLPSIDSTHQIVLVLLFNSLLDHSSRLITISADSGTILNSVILAGIGVELATNRNTILVATKSPLALHLYGWNQGPNFNELSLAQLPCSPILDLAPRPKTGHPVFHLGQNRLLAYASSKPPNERESHIATGPSFSFVVPPHDPYSPSAVEPARESKESGFGLNGLSAARNSSPAGTNGSSWRNSVAPNLDAIDETARKLGGGLLNGAKYLSSWGQNLWNPNVDNINLPRQTFHHSPRNDLGIAFSQSAPLPHKMSAACPASYSGYEESQGSSHGIVQIIDLFGDTCSNRNARGHQPSICHFKISSDPLTFLSLNPSSSLLLTSSIQGHSFHIFELRPSSRIGKSYLNASRLENTCSRRETTVWHRYKLTRGFTSAEVIDVAWRWDSKVVSVLTEHGTNHLFAIHPAGGAAGAEPADASRSPRGADPLFSTFSSRVHNPRIPQPLSVTVSSFEKIKHKPLRNPSLHPPFDQTGMTAAFGSADYFDHLSHEHENIGNTSHFRHTSLVFVQPRSEHLSNSSQEDKPQVLFELHKRLPSVLLYDPSTNSVTLYNFEVKKRLLNAVTSGVSSGPGKITVTNGPSSDSEEHTNVKTKSHASSSPSGLSQLLQQNKQAGPKYNGYDLQTPSSNVFIHSFASAVWNLGAMQDPIMINTNRFYGSTFSNPPKSRADPNSGFIGYLTANGQNWTSFAELDTFSHSLRILPRSIYTSHQFDFYNFIQSRKSLSPSFSNPTYQSFNSNANVKEQFTRADFDHVKKKKLIVKREVQIQPGDWSSQQDSTELFPLSTVEINDNFINPHFSGSRIIETTTYNQMYAAPIRSAVEAVLDPTLASPKSPLNIFPEFPNGRPARKASQVSHSPLISFKKSLASNVAPVVGVVNERMRKELGKITSSAALGEVGRRRISGVGYWNGISESLGQRLIRKPEVDDGSKYGSEGITPLSFEDDQDEAIRIDRSLFDDQGPSSSSMNSFTSTNSLANPNSDELGLESNSRSGQSIMDEDVADEMCDRWDGWTFEDDLEIKTQSEPKDLLSLPSEIRLGGSLQQQHDVHPQELKEETRWTSPKMRSILIANQSTGLMTQLPHNKLKEDDAQQGDDGIDFKKHGKLSSPKSLLHLQVKDNRADSDLYSGSRSSSALSTSTSASASGEDSSSNEKTEARQIDLPPPKTPLVQRSSASRSSKNPKSNRTSLNHKKR